MVTDENGTTVRWSGKQILLAKPLRLIGIRQSVHFSMIVQRYLLCSLRYLCGNEMNRITRITTHNTQILKICTDHRPIKIKQMLRS